MAKQRTDKRLSVYLPADLHERLAALPKINKSRVCRMALEQAVAGHLGHGETQTAGEAMTELPRIERDLRNLRNAFGRFAREAAEHAGLVVLTKEEAERQADQQEAIDAAVAGDEDEDFLPDEEAIQGGVASSEVEERSPPPFFPPEEATGAPSPEDKLWEERTGSLPKPRTCGKCVHLLFESMECSTMSRSPHKGEERSPDDEACEHLEMRCSGCGHLASLHGERVVKGLEHFRFCSGGMGDCECPATRCEVIQMCVCDSQHCSVYTNDVIRKADEAEARIADADEVRDSLPTQSVPVYAAPLEGGSHFPVVMSGAQDPMHGQPLMEEATPIASSEPEDPEPPAEVEERSPPPFFPPETEFLPDDAELEWLLPGIMFQKVWDTGALRKKLRPLEFQAPIADRSLKRWGKMTLRELPMEGGPATGRKIIVDILKTSPAERYQDTDQVRFSFKVLECQEPPRCAGTDCDANGDTNCSQCGAPLCWACWAGDSGVDEEPAGLCPTCDAALNEPDQPAPPAE